MSDKPHIFPQGSNKWKTRPRPFGPAHAYSLSLPILHLPLSTSTILFPNTDDPRFPCPPFPLVYLSCSPIFRSSKYFYAIRLRTLRCKDNGDCYLDSNHSCRVWRLDSLSNILPGGDPPRYFSSTSRLHYSSGPLPPTTTFLLLKVIQGVSLTDFARGD